MDLNTKIKELNIFTWLHPFLENGDLLSKDNLKALSAKEKLKAYGIISISIDKINDGKYKFVIRLKDTIFIYHYFSYEDKYECLGERKIC